MSNAVEARWLARIVAPPGLVRILLAALVLISHVSRFDMGRAGVILFFVLSGYWVTKVYVGEYERHVPRFLLSRLWRLAPVYIVSLVLASLLRGLPLAPSEFFLLGVATTHRDPTGVAWSLDIELQFYAALPLLLLFWNRTNDAAFVLLCAVLTCGGWFLTLHYDLWTFARFMPAFMAGMLMTRDQRTPSSAVAVGWLGVFLALVLALPFTAVGLAQFDKLKADYMPQDLFSMLLVLPLLPYLAVSVRHRSTKLDRALGNLSYPLYLVHFPIIAVVLAHAHGVLDKAFAAAIAMAVALLLYFAVDRPSEWLRKRELRLYRDNARQRLPA